MKLNRAQRRAAMHPPTPQAAALPTNTTTSPTPEPAAAPTPTRQISEAQIKANKQNAEKSTGPKSDTGKWRSSHNSVKTALTGQTILLPTDDAEAYQEFGQTFADHFKPATLEEKLLLQSIIDTDWRLQRIPLLEANIYAIGRQELAGTVPNEHLEATVYLKYERNLKNLSLQEHRPRRNREKDMARLKELQADRREAEAIRRKVQQAKEKQQQAAEVQQEAQPTQPPPVGFVFSTPATSAEPPLAEAA